MRGRLVDQGASACPSAKVTTRRSFIEQSDAKVLTSDYIFSSVSAAAATMTSAAENSWIS
jgi:hypothetical protein